MRFCFSRAAVCAAVAATALLTAAAQAQTYDTRTLAIRAIAVVSSPATGRLYASVGSDDATYPNSVVAIDPERGAVEWAVRLRHTPGILAVSDDGAFVYAGLRDTTAVARVSTASRSVDGLVGLGATRQPPYGTTFAQDIEVQPGSPRVIAVVSDGRIALFDGQTRLPDLPPVDVFGSSAVITFGATPNRLYGYNGNTSGYEFRRYDVSTRGIQQISRDDAFSNELISGFGADIVSAGGRVVASTGRVIDPEARVRLGQFALQNLYRNSGYRPAVDVAAGRTFFVEEPGNGVTQIGAFENATFARLGGQRLAGVSGTRGNYFAYALGLQRWGADGLAFVSPEQGVVLVRTPLVREALAGIAFGAAAVEFGRVTGIAEQPLTVRNPGTKALVVTRVASTLSSFSFSPSRFTLAPGESLTGTVRLLPRIGGELQGTLVFASNALTSPDAIAVSAYADVPAIGLSRTQVTFRQIEPGEEVTETVSVRSAGTRPVQVTAARSSDPRLTVTLTEIDPQYGVGALDLRFAPGDSLAALDAVVVVESTALVSPDTLRVRGVVAGVARFVFGPGFIDFGEVEAGQVRESETTLFNVGTGPLVVTAAESSNPAFSFSPAQVTLAPGDSVRATVRFAASRIGRDGARIALASNAENTRELYITATVVPATAGENGPGAVETALADLAPNPTRTTTTVRFSLAEAAEVRLAVFDVHGREVLRIADGPLPAGTHTAAVDVRALAAGVYVVRMDAGPYRSSRTLTVVGR